MGADETSEDELLEAAEAELASAYAPYSGFRVGAALETDDGRRFAGGNVENASSPAGICAERVALGAAVSDGARGFRRLALAASSQEPVTPCGMCRQALAEFGTGLVIVSRGADGRRRRWTLGDLLPEPFARSSTGRQGEASRG